MSQIIANSPQQGSFYRRRVLYEDHSSGIGFVVGIILAATIAILLLAYAIPALKSAGQKSGTTSVPDNIQIDSSQPSSFLQ